MTAREVLQELVACADLLRELNDSRARDLDVKSPRSIDLERDYDMRAPLAWNAARAYLAQSEPQDEARDAARYRWLRDSLATAEWEVRVRHGPQYIPPWLWCDAERLDSRIDAAIAAQDKESAK